MQIRRARTDDLTAAELRSVRRLLDAAFSTGNVPLEEWFTEDDWQHSLGGTHLLGSLDGRLVAHGSVVERRLEIGLEEPMPLRTGYVEAVAVLPELHGRGLGTELMRTVNEVVSERYELGGLGTSAIGFYERLGWEVWRGPTYVRTEAGALRTADEDGGIMVLRTPATPALDLTAPLSCEWRAGDVW